MLFCFIFVQFNSNPWSIGHSKIPVFHTQKTTKNVTNPTQIATAFNVALCAEAAGRDGEARSLYERLLSIASVSEARDRLEAIDARARAERQLRVHEQG